MTEYSTWKPDIYKIQHGISLRATVKKKKSGVEEFDYKFLLSTSVSLCSSVI